MSKRRVHEHRSEDEDPRREGGREDKDPDSDWMLLLGTEVPISVLYQDWM